METYRIASIKSSNDGYLELRTADGRIIPAFVPESCAHMLRCGMQIKIHRNRGGNAVACSFGDVIVFMRRPTTYKNIKEFVGDFKDIYEFSLDSLVFRYSLHKALSNMGLKPTYNMITNIMMYNYINNITSSR